LECVEVIILDTHVWVWWVDGGGQLPADYLTLIQAEAASGLGVCAISCWEVAKLVELGRLQLAIAVDRWLAQALLPPIQLLPLTPEVAVGSTQLPGAFHRDPADQLIVATARQYDCPLVTLDRMIRAYTHVRLAP
jgi:PIN domain nuclease of toxin-antitoxin system